MQNGLYKFVMFNGTTQNGQAKILTKNNPDDTDVIELIVPQASLSQYAANLQIMQNFKPNEASMNEEDLLETYVIKN